MSTFNYAITADDIPGKMFAAETPSTASWHTVNFNVGPGVPPRRSVSITVSAAIEISNDNAGAAKFAVPANQPFDIEIGGKARTTFYINGASSYTFYVAVSK